MGGLAVAGALTSALRLITKAAFDNSNDGQRKGASEFTIFGKILIPKPDNISCFAIFLFFLLAVIFLAISTFIEFLCVLHYAYVFPKLPIVKYYRRKAASEGSKTVSADLAAAGIQNQSDVVTLD